MLQENLFAGLAILDRLLFEQKNEKVSRTSVRGTVVGNAKIVSYDDILEAQRSREAEVVYQKWPATGRPSHRDYNNGDGQGTAPRLRLWDCRVSVLSYIFFVTITPAYAIALRSLLCLGLLALSLNLDSTSVARVIRSSPYFYFAPDLSLLASQGHLSTVLCALACVSPTTWIEKDRQKASARKSVLKIRRLILKKFQPFLGCYATRVIVVKYPFLNLHDIPHHLQSCRMLT